MATPPNPQTSKYCKTCGRLISSNHRNFEERKHCSKQCSSKRLNEHDAKLEQLFTQLSREHGQVTCGRVEEVFLSSTPDFALPEQNSADAQKAGMEKANLRERVRRAGRRVVAFAVEDDASFECVQGNKAVEPSFAKGEWAVRIVRR